MINLWGETMVITCKNQMLANRVAVASTFFTRFKGLMGKRGLQCGEGLLLKCCPSVHSFFMRMTVDVVYLSRDMKILDKETIKPWRIGKQVKNTAHILELAAGTAWVSVGDRLELQYEQEGK